MKKYNHKEIENQFYQNWIKEGYFTAGDLSKEPFTIVIPPPNVTGKLHLGHAWDNTLQDIIARYKRLSGYDMLWLPGMDHAGIATQAKVDERLKSMGISRYDIGREKFLEQAWGWKEEYSSFIRSQWEKLGLALDYSRERFTLDDGLSKAVKKVFVDLYNDGLIYRGKRIINWDPEAKTALSNIEVIHKEVEGAMYTFKYRVVDSDEILEVATTRPETMFGDVCVVVNPKDERYQHLIGKSVINPANQEILPIIADDYIDIEFGTGAMKCTPAHDPNDFTIGEKHHLPQIICMNEDGTMNERALEFEGLDRFEARKKLVEKMQQQGDFVKQEKHLHQVAHSERTDAIVEPYLSNQWFVKMKPLAAAVLAAQENEDEKITFYPKRFEKVFTGWLEKIEDWCISRQLWWGHRIPAYYHKITNEIVVGDAPADIENYIEDEDVLDTWFSSALWPFSTLGWPENTADFNRYYPNDLLVTGYDIIFFWVARMAFQARYATNSRPFKEVLIHGLIRAEDGRKMSKSLGNGIDPMDVIEQYGTDALRFFLTTNSTPGQDLRYSQEKVEAAWNFINKIFNATQFAKKYFGENEILETYDFDNATLIDKWIIQKLNDTIEEVTLNMDRYEFAIAGNRLYDFIWNDFCNWYIEFAKVNLNSNNAEQKQTTLQTLHYVLKNIMILIHPYMPYVSEALYLELPHAKKSIHLEHYPKPLAINCEKEVKSVQNLINIITTIREIKQEYNLKPSFELNVVIKTKEEKNQNLSDIEINIIKKMTHTNVVESLQGELVVRLLENGTLSLALDSIVDKEEELKKLKLELEKLNSEIQRAEGMLSNENFVAKAPASKIELEKEKLAKFIAQKEIILAKLK